MAGDMYDKTKDAARDVKDSYNYSQNRNENITDQAKDLAGSAYEKTKDMAGQVFDSAKTLAKDANSAFQHSRQQDTYTDQAKDLAGAAFDKTKDVAA